MITGRPVSYCFFVVLSERPEGAELAEHAAFAEPAGLAEGAERAENKTTRRGG